VNSALAFEIGSQSVEFVSQWSHLGHIMSCDIDDWHDIMRYHDSLLNKSITFCFFRELDPMIKLRLLVSYCYSLYGSVLWDACSAYIEQLCCTWRVAIRHVWGLPYTTHNLLLP